jgi:tRNA 2-thiouridine synthesizing protein A
VSAPPEADVVLDGGDQACGELILTLKRAVDRLGAGQILKLLCRDPAAPVDLPAWCRLTGHRLIWADGHTFYIERRGIP